MVKREQDQAAKGNTLDKTAEKFKEGPLLLLRRYYKTSVRLQVVTRHASGVRGTATGICNNSIPLYAAFYVRPSLVSANRMTLSANVCCCILHCASGVRATATGTPNSAFCVCSQLAVDLALIRHTSFAHRHGPTRCASAHTSRHDMPEAISHGLCQAVIACS